MKMKMSERPQNQDKTDIKQKPKGKQKQKRIGDEEMKKKRNRNNRTAANVKIIHKKESDKQNKSTGIKWRHINDNNKGGNLKLQLSKHRKQKRN